MKGITILIVALLLSSCGAQEGAWVVRYDHHWKTNRIIEDSIYLNPGDVYVYVSDWGNPFGGIKYSEWKFMAVKDGWVQYKYRPSWTPLKVIWTTNEIESCQFTQQIYNNHKGKYLTLDDIK